MLSYSMHDNDIQSDDSCARHLAQILSLGKQMLQIRQQCPSATYLLGFHNGALGIVNLGSHRRT